MSTIDLDQYKSTGYISVYRPVAGWKAIQYWWNPEEGGFWEPWQTGYFAFDTPEKATEDAKQWAESEEIPFVDFELKAK